MPAKRELPGLSVVIGGAGSGKSAFAESIVRSVACEAHYVATMRPSEDPEMADKIRSHQVARGAGWTTWEEPIEVSARVAALDGPVLIDCATLWLANIREAGRETEVEALPDALAAARAPVVVVTNEIGGGMVPMNAEARAFRDAHGRMNQALAARADLVVQVIAGLPLVLKGAL